MKVETLLPLGKVDPGLRVPETPLDIHRVGEDAKLVEAMGFDGLMVEETKQDPYLVMALAAQATTRLQLGTAVAIAFPRSPAITAMTAWTLAKLSRGRFTLGLGTQVKGHIERRFGVKWSAPGPWMRDYVNAVRAIWTAWQHGTPLAFDSQHYTLNLLVPLFTPEPIEHSDIPIHLAAVNAYMCRVAGEVADGVRPHPVCTAHYLREVMLPAVRKGAARAGRDLANFAVSIKPLIATAPDQAQLGQRIRDVRARVSFYASTPAYVACFEAHGLGDLARKIQGFSRAQRWEEMPALISDEVLNLYATVGTYDEIVDKLKARYHGLASNVEFSIPVRSEGDRERLAGMVAALQAG
ncbi:MAG: TIGR03617 family F420-dependent LLM class oxidoreductase [Gammaproteobacteria bacterium]|nr:TIGR03617 family F420-dependent LLM class oxidoreductase [Gammaproteobacteria bacterium]